MGTKDKILTWAKTHSPFQSHSLVNHLKISRQNVAVHLSQLVASGKLLKQGSTRGAVYLYPKKGKAVPPKTSKGILLIKKLKGMEEHRVFQELDRKLGLHSVLSKNAFTIASYAFTEMLNNAIDHSQSDAVKIAFNISGKSLSFSIRDYGIGIFKNVERTFKLANEFDALEHVFKGKQTTDPKRHSGEGIFFTSRIADCYSLRSHGIHTTIDNTVPDTFVKEERFLKGTLVTFKIRRQTRKTLSGLFQKFTNADFQFDKNQVNVKLSQEGGLLSRSQAKRLLSGMEKYTQITLDFQGVRELGQGFADEVFRVFKNAHPEIQLHYINASRAVDWMIRRALANNR